MHKISVQYIYICVHAQTRFLYFVESITHGLASKDTGAQYCMLAHDGAAAALWRGAPAQLEEDRFE